MRAALDTSRKCGQPRKSLVMVIVMQLVVVMVVAVAVAMAATRKKERSLILQLSAHSCMDVGTLSSVPFCSATGVWSLRSCVLK